MLAIWTPIVIIISIIIIWQCIRVICYNNVIEQLSMPRNNVVIYPKTVEEVQEIIRTAQRNNITISIKGGGYSMGGQCYSGSSETIQINTDYLNNIINFNLNKEQCKLVVNGMKLLIFY